VNKWYIADKGVIINEYSTVLKVPNHSNAHLLYKIYIIKNYKPKIIRKQIEQGYNERAYISHLIRDFFLLVFFFNL
jgi:uncharacterized protein involved in tolerance to divalent cations